MSTFDLARFRENPFDVLGVPVTATRQEVERAGQKLLGMLELDISSAKTYPTSLGPMDRTPERVRTSLAELRDPERRLLHEIWASPAPDAVSPSGSEETGEEHDAPWPGALGILGFRGAR
ncbi:MAG TPA: hypothetical protein VNO21_00200 [Polyangiaceae bacterium]|nr:hypothetical protein [Polyangiaceae bacterium]